MDCIEGMKLLPDNSIDCCITDCPYKIVAGGVTIIDKGNERSGMLNKRGCSNKRLKQGELNISSEVKKGKLFEHNDIQFSDWLIELYRIMKPKTHTYIMINGRNLKELQIECEKVGFKYQNLLIREKGNYTPNKYYMQGAEFILLLSKGGSKNINIMGSKNIIKIPNIIGKKQHPTEKPVQLYDYLLLNSTNEGDIVIDPFAGCGPIVASAIKNNRNYIGFELDEGYYKIANKRL